MLPEVSVLIKQPWYLADIFSNVLATDTLWLAREALQWRHNERDNVSNHQPHDCLLNRYSGADQRKHQSSASLAFVQGIHRGPVNSPHKGPVTRKMLPFDDVIIGEAWCVFSESTSHTDEFRFSSLLTYCIYHLVILNRVLLLINCIIKERNIHKQFGNY